MKAQLSAASAALAVALVAGAAQAGTVYNTSLGPMVGGTTTTDATGTRSTNAGSINTGAVPVYDTWEQENVRADGVVGITTDYPRSGNGSIFFSTDNYNSKADMEYYLSTPIALSSLEGASYDIYRDSSSTANANIAPSLRLIVGAGAYLIFEPVYNGLNTIPTDTWTTEAIGGSSYFWANNASNPTQPTDHTCTPQGQCATLSEWQASNPNAMIYGFSTGVGSGWGGTFSGGVDNISYTAGNQTTAFNFEVAGSQPGAVPEPATWALMLLGVGAAGAMMRRRSRAAAA